MENREVRKKRPDSGDESALVKSLDHFRDITKMIRFYNLTNQSDVMGRLFLVGPDPNHTVKLDLCYTDPFLHLALEQEGIRLATIGDVLAMKMEVVASINMIGNPYFNN